MWQGVAEAVEGDVLRDACRLEPLLQVIGHDARGEVLEHLTVLPFPAQPLISYFYTVFHLSQWGKHKKKISYYRLINFLISFDSFVNTLAKLSLYTTISTIL